MLPHENIKRFREEQNLKQSYMAEQLGITQQAYSYIECGRTKLTPEMAEKIAVILGKTMEQIYDSGETTALNNRLKEKIQELYEKLCRALERIVELEEELRKRKESI